MINTTWYRVNAWGRGYDNASKYWTKGTVLDVTRVLKPPRAYIDGSGIPQVGLDVKALQVNFVPGSGIKEQQSVSTPVGQPAEPGRGRAEKFDPNFQEEENLPF